MNIPIDYELAFIHFLKFGFMSKHIIYLLVFLNIIVSSCSKDWLDEKTNQNITVPASLKDFQALLDNSTNSYGNMNNASPSLSQVSSGESYLVDNAFSSITTNERNAYTWQELSPYEKTYDWILPYQRIAVCNLVLEGLSENISLTMPDLHEFNNVKGQALFQRARTFFELAELWSTPFIPSASNDELGIPIRTQSDINIPSVRSTVKDTYDKIISDLIDSKELLPITPKFKTRASRVASFALLARVYLSMELYHEAEKWADSCLSYYGMLLNYNYIDATASFPIPQFNTEVIFHSSLQNYSSIGSRLRIEKQFTDLYSDFDLRKRIFFGASGGLITFKGNYTGNSTRFNGLTTSEVLLIRAECYARKGDKDKAAFDLNTLLRSRWDSTEVYIDITATDAEDALRKVLLERKKELLVRGLRWSDLRRLNRDPRFADTLTRTVNGETYTLEPNSYKYTFPIPNDIIQMTGFQQNPGWEK